MFLTSGYVLNVCVPVKSVVLHTFRKDVSQKVERSCLGWDVLRDFRSDVLQKASLLCTVILQIFGALKFRWRAIAERSVSFKFRCPWMLS